MDAAAIGAHATSRLDYFATVTDVRVSLTAWRPCVATGSARVQKRDGLDEAHLRETLDLERELNVTHT